MSGRQNATLEIKPDPEPAGALDSGARPTAGDCNRAQTRRE